MATAYLALPERIEDDGIVDFVQQLVSCGSASEIIIDGVAAGIHAAGALAASASMRRRWERGGSAVKLINCDVWPLQKCFEGSFLARDSFGPGATIGLTSPVYEVLPAPGQVEEISSALAAAVAPGGWSSGPLYPLIQYCFGELLRNCVQHTGESGFAVVQERCSPLGPVEFVRLAVADCGRGARASFVENQSPEATPDMSDARAIDRALTPWISSTRYLPRLPYGHSSNMGVGLTMVKELARATAGHFAMISGTAWLLQTPNGASVTGSFYPAAWPGCIVAVSLGVKLLNDYGDMLVAARQALGLTPAKDIDKLFQ